MEREYYAMEESALCNQGRFFQMVTFAWNPGKSDWASHMDTWGSNI